MDPDASAVTFGAMRTAATNAAKVAGTLAVFGLLLPACLKVEEFPPEPAITFKSFEVFANDSASLVIGFTDGDGDIGLGPNDTAAPYDANLFLEYFEREDGVWSNIDLGGSPYIGYRIPNISPTGQNPTLEGEIAIALKPFSLMHAGDADTIKYGLSMRDRALHTSNTVETGTIVVP